MYPLSAVRQVPRFVNTLKEAAKPAQQSLLAVARPFGYAQRVLLGNTFGIFSKEAKEHRQRQLDHDIAHSPFYESKSFSNTGGKIFTAPKSYFKADRSLYFPDFQAYTLDNQRRFLYDTLKGEVTVLRLFSTISGERCVNSFVQPDLANLDLKAQVVDVNVAQSWVKGLFVKLSKGNLRKAVKPERHSLYFFVPSGLFPVEVKKTLMCDNMCLGYVYVLDAAGRIRWAASGYASDDEQEQLSRVLRGLHREMELAT